MQSAADLFSARRHAYRWWEWFATFIRKAWKSRRNRSFTFPRCRPDSRPLRSRFEPKWTRPVSHRRCARLGAAPSDVLRRIVGHGLTLAAVGVANRSRRRAGVVASADERPVRDEADRSDDVCIGGGRASGNCGYRELSARAPGYASGPDDGAAARVMSYRSLTVAAQ